jgi:hypothetical protein
VLFQLTNNFASHLPFISSILVHDADESLIIFALDWCLTAVQKQCLDVGVQASTRSAIITPAKNYLDEGLQSRPASVKRLISLPGVNESPNETAGPSFCEMIMAGLKEARWS